MFGRYGTKHSDRKTTSAFGMYETKESGNKTANLYLQYKWDVLNHENHRYNVRTAKSRIDTSAPRIFTHLYYRPKKLQLEMERFCEIQRNNRHLMDRLATVKRLGAWVDHKNFHEIKSLNTWKRQQKMIELAYSNQAMLNRLLSVQSQYNHLKIADEYMLTRKHKANVEKFPKDWKKLQYQAQCMRKHLRAKVLANRTGKLTEDDKISKAKIEEEAAEIAKAVESRKTKEAQRIVEERQKEKDPKAERLRVIRERRRAMIEWEKASKEWREVRDARLKLIKEYKKEEEKKLNALRKLEAEKEKKRREKIKEKLDNWRKWKSENEELSWKKRKGKKLRSNYLPVFYKFKEEDDAVVQTDKKYPGEARSSDSESDYENPEEDDNNDKLKLENLEDDKKLKDFKLGGNKPISKKAVTVGKKSGKTRDTKLIRRSASAEFDPKVVVLEGGKEVDVVEKHVLQDLRDHPDKKVSETAVGYQDMKKKSKSEEFFDPKLVVLEGGKKLEVVEKDVLKDLRDHPDKKVSETAVGYEDMKEESKSDEFFDTESILLEEGKKRETIRKKEFKSEEFFDPELVLLDGGQTLEVVEKDVLDDLRTEDSIVPDTAVGFEDMNKQSTGKKDINKKIENKSKADLFRSSSEEVLGTREPVFLEGGEKEEKIEKKIVDDLRADPAKYIDEKAVGYEDMKKLVERSEKDDIKKKDGDKKKDSEKSYTEIDSESNIPKTNKENVVGYKDTKKKAEKLKKKKIREALSKSDTQVGKSEIFDKSFEADDFYLSKAIEYMKMKQVKNIGVGPTEDMEIERRGIIEDSTFEVVVDFSKINSTSVDNMKDDSMKEEDKEASEEEIENENIHFYYLF